ncbi:MAG TPA: sugar ABC transporter ATP-binding protein [Vicinamibacteria bacterium]|nr:sugar ABC transporter ATP-binding protein [Vicinamibacteria bacterium]
MTPPPPLLEVHALTKRFGAQAALEDVSLTIAAGEVHALAGENGAGKSTLMAILSGALVPDAGTIRWEGRPVLLPDVRAAQALGVSAVHQEPQLVASLGVAENIALGRLPHRAGPLRLVDAGAMRAAARAALDRLGVAVPLEAPIGEIGVAQRQLVAIARALHFGARLIILDEPTSSLSLSEVEALLASLRALRQRGTALVYISHRLEELRAIADRVTVLRDGRVVATAPMAGMSNEALIQAMSGRELAADLRAGPPPAGTEPRLRVRDLARKGRLHAITLEVREGEVVGLAGLMGSGRSRALRTIFGADGRDAGTVEVRGPDGWRGVHDVAGGIAAGLGLVPEDRRGLGLVFTATVADNIGLRTPKGGHRWGLLRRGVLRAVAEAAVEILHIKTRGIDAAVRTLSGGNQQKVVLGRWLGDTRVLLLDEPTRGVDVSAKAEIHRHLRALAASGMALLVASSEIPELLALCDRILVMREGRLAGELTRAEATPAAILALATGAAAARAS